MTVNGNDLFKTLNSVITEVAISKNNRYIYENVLIRDKKNISETLPSMVDEYLYCEWRYANLCESLVTIIDRNNTSDYEIINKCPKKLVEFVRGILYAIRSFKIPDVYNTIQFEQNLRFIIVSNKLMKHNMGYKMFVPFTTIRKFYKNENLINKFFEDIAKCATKTHITIRIAWGISNTEDPDILDAACYKLAELDIPIKK